MPHKCARCERIYDSTSKELLQGCPCGSRLFLFLRDKFGDRMAKKGTIRLDVENMTRLEEGKFTLDVASLMSGKPIVVRADEGVYYIDIPYAMKPKKKKK
jgi:predicted  nucleic acid-binding Zn-ribbon protein